MFQQANDEFRNSRTSTIYPETELYDDTADLQSTQSAENYQSKDVHSLTYTFILLILFLLSLVVLCLVCQRLIPRFRFGKSEYQSVPQLDILHPQSQSSQSVTTQTGFQRITTQPSNVETAKTRNFIGVPTPFEQAEILRRSSSPKY